jgi:hypothetical protein
VRQNCGLAMAAASDESNSLLDRHNVFADISRLIVGYYYQETSNISGVCLFAFVDAFFFFFGALFQFLALTFCRLILHPSEAIHIVKFLLFNKKQNVPKDATEAERFDFCWIGRFFCFCCSPVFGFRIGFETLKTLVKLDCFVFRLQLLLWQNWILPCYSVKQFPGDNAASLKSKQPSTIQILLWNVDQSIAFVCCRYYGTACRIARGGDGVLPCFESIGQHWCEFVEVNVRMLKHNLTTTTTTTYSSEDDMEIDHDEKVKMLMEFYDKTEDRKYSLTGCRCCLNLVLMFDVHIYLCMIIWLCEYVGIYRCGIHVSCLWSWHCGFFVLSFLLLRLLHSISYTTDGEKPTERDLLEHYYHVSEVYLSLKPAWAIDVVALRRCVIDGQKRRYQAVIKDICKRMGAGMAEFIEADVATLKDYEVIAWRAAFKRQLLMTRHSCTVTTLPD